MEIVKGVRDPAAVLDFLGVLTTPRAILTYFTLRGEKPNGLAVPGALRVSGRCHRSGWNVEPEKKEIGLWNR